MHGTINFRKLDSDRLSLFSKDQPKWQTDRKKKQTAYHITCNFPENNQSYLPGRRSRHFLLWYFQVPCDQPIPKLALVHFLAASDLLFVAPSWIFFFPRRARAFCSVELEIPRAQGSKIPRRAERAPFLFVRQSEDWISLKCQSSPAALAPGRETGCNAGRDDWDFSV